MHLRLSYLNPKLLSTALGCMLLALPLAGCKSPSDPTPENFTKGLTKYLADHPDCLYKTPLRFPYSTSDAAEMHQLDALVTNKLLEKNSEPAIHVTRYTVSDYGQKSAPRFCYGFRHVTGIESSTPPVKAATGFNESKVTYRYELQDTPVWAKSASVQSAFPEMAKAVNADGTSTINLAQTGVGWQVPD